MAFKVTIEETRLVERPRGEEYLVVADTGGPGDGQKREWVKAPGVQYEEVTDRTYEQRVDDLDLQAVIRAVNGMS